MALRGEHSDREDYQELFGKHTSANASLSSQPPAKWGVAGSTIKNAAANLGDSDTLITFNGYSLKKEWPTHTLTTTSVDKKNKIPVDPPTFGDINELMLEWGARSYEAGRAMGKVEGREETKAKRYIRTLTADKIRSTLVSQRWLIGVAAVGLLTAAVTQVPALTGLHHCGEEATDLDKYKCKVNGYTAITLVVLAGIGGICALVGAYYGFRSSRAERQAQAETDRIAKDHGMGIV